MFQEYHNLTGELPMEKYSEQTITKSKDLYKLCKDVMCNSADWKLIRSIQNIHANNEGYKIK